MYVRAVRKRFAGGRDVALVGCPEESLWIA